MGFFFVYRTLFSPRVLTLNGRASRRAVALRNSATLLYPDFLAHAFPARGQKFVESPQRQQFFFSSSFGKICDVLILGLRQSKGYEQAACEQS